jgi:RHS repeat-associated protein
MTQNARQLPARSRAVKDGVVTLDDTYTFDATGNVTDIFDQAETGISTRGMSYDGLDRLRVAVAPGLWGTASYTYDALDNLRSADQGARQYRYVYDATSNRLNQINNAAGVSQMTMGYNPAGDITSKGSAAYTFDAAHRLLAVANTASYIYDGHGRRVKESKTATKKSPSEIGIYNRAGQKLYRKQIDNNTTTRYVYLNGTQIASTDVVNGGAAPATYSHTDALGSVVAETSSTGALLRRYRYAPYGESMNLAAGTLMDGLGYTGHEMDADTGLTYMQQRYYDPVVGRFLSIDPVAADAQTGGNFNRYWYANNNPYRFVDPDGRYVWLAFAGRVAIREAVRHAAPVVGEVVVEVAGQEAANVYGEHYAENFSRSGQFSESGEPTGTAEVKPGDAFPDRELPRGRDGEPVVDPEAEGSAHTQLGTANGSKGPYPQAREFDADGEEVQTIDFTDHGRADHPNPHRHQRLPNPTGGTPKRGPPEPLPKPEPTQ